MASPRWMLSLLTLGIGAITLVSAARQFHDEFLRSNPDNVARRQKRSLDAADSPEYYNDLHSFKYHGGDADRKFDRDFDEDDEEIEFLPGDNGQLETVGEGLQGINNKLLERALLDYLETLSEQEEPVASIFRERERSGSRKRGGTGERLNLDDKDPRLFVEELQDGSPYGPLVEMDMDDYLTALQSLYDRYRAGRGNKVYETAGPMSWGELLSKGPLLRGQTKNGGDDEFVDRDQEQDILYLPAAERRNVNGRFPIGREFSNYRKLTKRYPVAKRSPRPTQTRSKTTDAKVAQDLGALFGTQFTDSNNHTHKPDHEHDRGRDRDQHEHKQEPGQSRDHEHQHEPSQNHEHEHGGHEGKTESLPKVTPTPKGQKENATKTTDSKFVQVRKKSVDWSQYFGIDRRRKKATFTAGRGTQNQDDEWMLQRYYENMAENLKPKDDENERKDKLEQMDAKLKYIKDLIIEEAMKYAASLEDEADLQKVKDKLMSRMAAAYSLQKMRKALSDLRNSVQKEAQRTQKEAHNNFTSNFRENNGNTNPSADKSNEKRNSISNNIEENEPIEEPRSCPELEAIEWRCRTVDNLAGDTTRMLYVPCVKLQICKACAQDEEGLLPCLANYALEAGKVCDAFGSRDGQARIAAAREGGERQSCANAALLLSQLQPPTAATAQCRARNARDSCLRRYHARYEHRYFRTSPTYEGTGRRFHHEGALDALQQTMSER